MRRGPSTAPIPPKAAPKPCEVEEVEGPPVSLIRITLRRTGTRESPPPGVPSGGSGSGQQPQFLQVQGLHLQPPRVSSSAALVCSSDWVVIVILPLPRGVDSLRSRFYDIRTMVRDQAKSSDTIGGLAKAAGVGSNRPLLSATRAAGRAGAAARRGPPLRHRGRQAPPLHSLAQAAGFTLNEIKELLDLNSSDDRARARELANARVAAIDAKIAELGEARDALAGLATACARKRGGACPILSAFER